MKGTSVSVRMASANEYVGGAVKLNVAGTGSVNIQRYGTDTSSSNTLTWGSTSVLSFICIGAKWSFIGGELASTA